MDRRAFVAGAIGLLGRPRTGAAQARPVCFGFLTSGRCPDIPFTGQAGSLFLEGLRERDYVVGQNLTMVCRQAVEATDQRFRELAGELVGSNVQLIFAVSSAAVRGVRA